MRDVPHRQFAMILSSAGTAPIKEGEGMQADMQNRLTMENTELTLVPPVPPVPLVSMVLPVPTQTDMFQLKPARSNDNAVPFPQSTA